MIQVRQVLVSASDDTITRASLSLQTELRRLGPSEVFARHVDPALADSVRALDDFDRDGNRADLIVHHESIGDGPLISFLTGRSEQIALVYHDGVPDELLRPYDPVLATCLESRREELGQLAGRVALAIAGTELGASELRALGYRHVVVTPLAVDVRALLAVAPDPGMEAYLAALDGPTFLFVGELLPHKRLEWLLAAYHAVVTYLEPRAHLVVVGAGPVKSYPRALDAYVAELQLDRAHILGGVSRESLAACYRAADAFVTASEHEGDCVPLLEAMAFDLPVIARAHAALPETVASAGLVLGPGDGPLVAAEAMATVARDEEVRASLVDRARLRIAGMDLDSARARLVTHLMSVVS